jgi:membrane protease YdiL (CAAX protease family)
MDGNVKSSDEYNTHLPNMPVYAQEALKQNISLNKFLVDTLGLDDNVVEALIANWNTSDITKDLNTSDENLSLIIENDDKFWIVFDIFVAYAIYICSDIFFDKLLIGNQSSPLSDFPLDLLSVFITSVSLVIAVSYFYFRYPFTVSHFGFGNQDIRDTIICGIGGGIILVLLNFPYPIVFKGQSIPEFVYYIETQQGMHFVFSLLIFAVIILPFIEELFFRVFLFGLVRNKYGLTAGYLVSTFFFALGHRLAPIHMINSLIFCYLYEKTGRIGVSIIAHILTNFAWYTAIYIGT